LKLREILNDFASIIYPPVCSACQKVLTRGEHQICTICLGNLPRLATDQNQKLQERITARIPFVCVSAYLHFRKNGMVQNLLHSLKYKDNPLLARQLGKMMALEMLRRQGQSWDVILAVPLHKRKHQLRGYNQSEELAMGISSALGIPVNFSSLSRIHNNVTQTKKSRLNRWRNVNEIFLVNPQAELRGKNILLVDDVVTTGATVEAAGSVLFASGCESISVCFLASA